MHDSRKMHKFTFSYHFCILLPSFGCFAHFRLQEKKFISGFQRNNAQKMHQKKLKNSYSLSCFLRSFPV